MTTTRISKIRVRQGNFGDLPMLDAGEFGYAKDQRRLFIGNDTITAGTGNGSIDTFIIDCDVSSPNIIAVFVDGTQVSPANYSLVGTTLTLATPPGAGDVVTVKFNSEVDIVKDISRPSIISLAANGSSAETGFSIDTTQYNTCFMDYTLQSSNGLRVGKLRFGVDTAASLTIIDDDNVETATVDIVFSLDISTPDTLKLLYTDNDNAIATFKYTYQLWNSN
jgi:hypothetical protein